MKTTVSRRDVLRHLGIGAAFLPVLESLPAFGAATAPPKRLLIIVWTNGVIEPQFWPQGGGENLNALTLPPITAPLAPHLQDLLFVSGIETKNAMDAGLGSFGHQTYATTFTGTRGEPFNADGEPSARAVSASIDQVIADAVAKQVPLPVRSLHLGVMRGGNSYTNCCFYRGDGQPVAPEHSPSAAISKLFMGTGTKVRADLARRVVERKSLLDAAAADLVRFGQHLGVDDRRKLVGHLDSVREVERQVSRLARSRCEGPTVGQIEATSDNYPAIVAAHTDIIINAFKCDLTRVATLQMSDYNGDRMSFPWLGDMGKAITFRSRDHHDLAHHPKSALGPKEGKARVDTWFVQQFANMVKKFKAVPEGEGDLLDTTAIMFVNHMSDGQRHSYDSLPLILAGRAGGYLKTGRFLRARSRTPTNQLFVGLAEAMGTPLPKQTFGNVEYKGLLPGLSG